jgi:hypothetical protein
LSSEDDIVFTPRKLLKKGLAEVHYAHEYPVMEGNSRAFCAASESEDGQF